MNIGIIIQARMGSSRLPGKVLKKIGQKKLLEHILFRLKRLKHKTVIIVATSILEKDSVIERFCQTNFVKWFRGDETNLLERYFLCAKKNSFDHIVRLTADNPFIDIEELDNLISLHLDSCADYSRSFAVLPKGVGAEIFTFEALEKSYLYGTQENHKEHVNEYIEENETLFKISELHVINNKMRPEISLTVDTEDDYQKACYIVGKSTSGYITTQEAIELCSLYA